MFIVTVTLENAHQRLRMTLTELIVLCMKLHEDEKK